MFILKIRQIFHYLRHERSEIREIITKLGDGAVVALPTDTVYGLAADPGNSAAIRRLKDLKKRDKNKPFVLMLPDLKAVESLVTVPAGVRGLLARNWPGALTVILKDNTAGHTIGVRVPDFPPLLRLLKAWDRPLAVTSANISGEKELSCMGEIRRYFGLGIGYFWDIPVAFSGIASTIIEATGPAMRILRQGEVKIRGKSRTEA